MGRKDMKEAIDKQGTQSMKHEGHVKRESNLCKRRERRKQST